MAEHDRKAEPSDRQADEPTPFERFESVAKRLLHVSKDDLRAAEARERDRRRTA